MSNYTTALVERETMHKIKRIAEETRRKQIDVIALAIDLYAKTLETGKIADPSPTPTAQ